MERKQVKVWIDPEIAVAFKAACIAAGVSMANELSNFMAERTKIFNDIGKKNDDCIKRRGGRRKEVNRIILMLEKLRDQEEDYKDRIPENLQSGAAYEAAEHSVDIYDQVIELLSEAY